MSENINENKNPEDISLEENAAADTEKKDVSEESSAEENAQKNNSGQENKGGRKKKKKKSKPVDEKAPEDVPEKNESESEGDKKRFRFDWELEENLKEALDEDAMDLTEAAEDESEPIEIEGKSAVTPAQAAQTVFGLFLIIFSIIGVVATGLKLYQLHEAQKDNSEQVAYFEQFLLPLAACDAPTFDGAPSLNEDVMISAACWDIIFNPSAFYERSGESYKVSYVDVDRRIAKLFGPGLNYSHKTVGDTELRFTYNEDEGMYLIPAFPRSNAYYPEVTEITEKDDGALELTVCYHIPITNWIDSVDSVEKTMIYTLMPNDRDYIVTAISIGAIDESDAV